MLYSKTFKKHYKAVVNRMPLLTFKISNNLEEVHHKLAFLTEVNPSTIMDRPAVEKFRMIKLLFYKKQIIDSRRNFLIW